MRDGGGCGGGGRGSHKVRVEGMDGEGLAFDRNEDNESIVTGD